MTAATSRSFRRAALIAKVSLIVLFPHFVAAVHAADQVPHTILADRDYKINEHVNEWEQFPPTVRIEGAMDIWIGQNEEGLVVVGQGPALVNMKDGGTNVWVADEKHVILPSIGWRERFGDFYLPSEDYCVADHPDIYPEGRFPEAGLEDACRAWFRSQVEYRKVVRKLFERRWDISGYGDSEETLATRAFAGLDSGERKALEALDPNGEDQAGPSVRIWGRHSIRSEIGRFEFKIPWSALPPSHSLEFKALRFAISTRTGPGAELDMGERVHWGGVVWLVEPRNYLITPCKYPLAGVHIAHSRSSNWEEWSYRDDRSGIDPSGMLRWIAASSYIRHTDSLDARKVVVLHNSDDHLASGPILSPRATLRKHFVLATRGETIVCGPTLAVVSPNGERLIANALSESSLEGPAYSGIGEHVGNPRQPRADYVITRGEINVAAEARGFQDYLLVRSTKGPFVYPLCGGTGGCAQRIRYEVFKVSQDPIALSLAFHFEGKSQIYNYFDIWMDDSDWNEIHVIDSRHGNVFPMECKDLLWRKTTFCRDRISGVFLKCREEDKAPMPDTIRIDWPMECRNPPAYVGETE